MASAAPLPPPMLARSGPIPTRGDYAYEVKWDAFRGLLSTENGLRPRSRRGWDMTPLVPELAALPVAARQGLQALIFLNTRVTAFVINYFVKRRREV